MTRGEQQTAAAFLRKMARGKQIESTYLARQGNEFAVRELDRAQALTYAADFLDGCAANTDSGESSDG